MRRTLIEIANELGLNLDTLNRWIRQGKIPVHKQGNIGIYSEFELSRWAEKQRRTPISVEDDNSIEKEEKFNSNNLLSPSVSILLSALKRGGVFHNIAGNTKEEVIASAIDIIPDFPGKDRDEIYYQLMERETLASTAIGKGIAIPHPRNPLSHVKEPMIITCFLENSVEFHAIDDRPVSILFIILSPSVEIHLNLLSRLSFCLRDIGFIAFVEQKPDSYLLFERVEEMESNIDRRDI